ncbi:MAG: Nif3-like dinuclear metal center hexameric protein [Candidatus Nanopelagicales bacterium]|nr:Nif3-like dinuclear metal center hexameric protein [Candidatus Nanopelagicales bacterium]
MSQPPLREVVSVLDLAYPPQLAADWDAVGLVCGDPDATVSKVLFAVDPVLEVIDEALLAQVDLIVTHHPLFLAGVHSVAATTAKGKIVHTLICHGIALFCAHTNADHATPGVSDALAEKLGIADLRPLVPTLGEPNTGTGRVGELPETLTLEQFAELVAAALPQTAHGVRVAGDPMTPVRTVAVCGGAGDSFLTAAARVADVYVTSDLRHHRALDHVADGGCALIDIAHWAGEWPWLEQAAGALTRGLSSAGSSVRTIVSQLPTDPWTTTVLQAPSPGSPS